MHQYFQKRGERGHYIRRVPAEYQSIDPRGTIRKALTESLEVARKRRDELMAADDQFWASVSEFPSVSIAWERYRKAKATAMAYGFQYKPVDEFATARTEERLARLKALETNKGELQKPSKNDTESLLGIVDRPQILLSQAFAIYCYKIATSKLIGKSEVQKKAWNKVNTREIANFTQFTVIFPCQRSLEVMRALSTNGGPVE